MIPEVKPTDRSTLSLIPGFVAASRRLRDAESGADMAAAAAGMHGVLDEVSGWLEASRSGAPADTAAADAAVLSLLLSVAAEASQGRHEGYPTRSDDAKQRARRAEIDTELLPPTFELRRRAIALATAHLARDAFRPLAADIQGEIVPLLESLDPTLCPDRYMPFRVIQIGNIAERLYGLGVRTGDPALVGPGGLLRAIFERKYLRFGTSGVRGRWGVDFTEARAKQVVQAICDYLLGQAPPAYANPEDLAGRTVVIGYDSRRNAGRVAEWMAEVCLGNGFRVELTDRDTPTPALVYYATEAVGEARLAGLINCTASHNPPEWQGIKFNPRHGYPAPTNVTDWIAARINEIQLLDEPVRVYPLHDEAEATAARAKGALRGFDPIAGYTEWILSSGVADGRLRIDWDQLRSFFAGRTVVVDEMHGAGRGYLSRILGAVGIAHTVIHAERNPDIPGLAYANPEEPFIQGLVDEVRRQGAWLGLGMDTDADRFGVVDRGGEYFRPNQLLPLLVRYLCLERHEPGRIVATQTGSPLIEVLAAQAERRDEDRPAPGVVPAYVDQAFYHLGVGRREQRVQAETFLVPVGIKYIEEVRRMDRGYRGYKELPPGWRELLLIGGEESSGLTTRGHVTDKDGIWADVLVMAMLAHFGSRPDRPLATIGELWRDTAALPGCWVSYGGAEARGSNCGRADVDAVLEAKEALIDHYLDLLARPGPDGRVLLAGLEVVYGGGVRYDVVEMQLADARGDDRHYLRVRASGTEPITRVYVESSDRELAATLMANVLQQLEALSAREIAVAHSTWRLADVLAFTAPTPRLVTEVRGALERRGWPAGDLAAQLGAYLPRLEHRNAVVARAWIDGLAEDEPGGHG